VRIAVLGETEVRRAEAPLDLGTRKQRAIVAALVLAHGRAVSYDALVDLLWGEHPPAGLPGTLHVYIAGLRRTLEPDRPARSPATILVTVGGGYALRVPDDQVDVTGFEQVVTAVHRSLGPIGLGDPPALSVEEASAARDRLDGALAAWRGTPYADLDDPDPVVAERARLEELYTLALEDRAVLGLALGDHQPLAGELEALTARHPLRERLWALRAMALARSGRQAEALEALREVRSVLDEELGLDASPQLRDLETAVLRQDPTLTWVPLDAVRPAGEGRDDTGPISWAPPAPPPWPMVGRGDELAELERLLGRAGTGTPIFAALTGDPGIGKSRLSRELAAAAMGRGVRVLWGRCSEDEGAPALWPWQQVFRSLGRELPADLGQDEGAEFRTWELVVGGVAEAAASETLLLVLDDLHWADPSTLRALRLLISTVETARLMVLVTWRPRPEPTGALADVAEALARRHALRLELTGLGPDEAATVVAAVTDLAPNAAEASVLAARTDGNPFFLVEYARLAGDGGDLAELLREPEPPAAVQEVLRRRLDRLPPATVGLLRWASVVGRAFDLDALASLAELDEDTVVDDLETALSAGLIREEGAGAYVFGHALVRDVTYGGLSATRRARAHARAAEAFEDTPERIGETAHHWLAAGPAHAGRAWRAAASAAAAAQQVHAYEQSAELLRSALAAQAADAGSGPRDRFDLLMDLASAHRWRGEWAPLLATIEEAITVADDVGDVRLLARAASAMTIGALWRSADASTTHEGVVDALRRALAALPRGDDSVRCHVMLALANETASVAPFAERLDLVESALAMARRLGDDSLVVDACEVAFMSLWQPDSAERRLALAGEAMDVAARIGNGRAFTVAAILTAVAHGELGQPESMWEIASLARDHAARLRLPYGLLVLDTLELPWLAMAGRFEEAEQRVERIFALGEQMQLKNVEDAMSGALVNLRLWQGRAAEMVEELTELDDLPSSALACQFMLRAGRVEQAREYLADHPAELETENWFSLMNWSAAAETALGLQDRDLAGRVYELLAPYAGRMACAGSGNATGPVDAFLALAAACLGRAEDAARHAADAQRLIEEWGLSLVGEWLEDQRVRFGF